MRKIIASCIIILLVSSLLAPVVSAQALKIGYVDLRRTFYEYEKRKSLDDDLNAVTTKKTEDRNKMVEQIRKMGEELEMLNDKARASKQKEIDEKINKLGEYDRDARQELSKRQNDIFREVIDDIQKIVSNIGKKENYDYILDSRNIMFSKETYDLTDRVIKELNK